MTTTIVVPCYNEAARLPVDAFRAFAEQSADARFLFVDDGSTDGTAVLIASLVADHPGRFRIFRLDANAGKSEAVRQGMLLALEGNPDAVGFWDADLSTPLNQLPLFQHVLAQRPFVQIVMGSRVRMLGRDIRRRPERHYVGRVGATLISLALHLGVYDTQCGAKLFRATPAVKSIWAEPFASRWLFDVEILFRFLHAFPSGDEREKAKEVLYELPLEVWRDVEGSKVRARHYARAFWDLYALWRYYRPQPNAGRKSGSMGSESKSRARCGRASSRATRGAALKPRMPNFRSAEKGLGVKGSFPPLGVDARQPSPCGSG